MPWDQPHPGIGVVTRASWQHGWTMPGTSLRPTPVGALGTNQPVQLKIWDGSAWIDPPVATQNLDGVGIATGYDSTNRLAVRSPATLLSHEGGGHQLKINKASAGDTASLLFQSNWTGHAEMGLSGSTGIAQSRSRRMAAVLDRGTWPLIPRTGTASGAAVQSQRRTTSTAGRLMRADFGYGPGNLVGPSIRKFRNVPTGAVIESWNHAEW